MFNYLETTFLKKYFCVEWLCVNSKELISRTSKICEIFPKQGICTNVIEILQKVKVLLNDYDSCTNNIHFLNHKVSP